MANSNDAAKESPENNKASKPVEITPILAGISLLLAIVAILIAIYGLQLDKHQQKGLAEDKSLLASQIKQLKENQKQAEESILATKKQAQEIKSQLQSNLENLQQSIQQRLNEKSNTEQDWQLLKAKYYLDLAQINAHWTNNYTTSIALLNEADHILQTFNDEQILTIRQIIAKDIATLQAIQPLDIAGILSRLEAIQAKVNQLKQHSKIEQISEQKSAPSSTESSWRTQLNNSVNQLHKLVIIRHRDEEIKPLLSPLFASIVKESVVLNLQQAQWAVLNNNEEVYQLMLKQAINGIKKIVNEQDQDIVALLKTLNELQQVKFNPAKPDIGQAIPVLNQFINTKQKLDKKGNNPTPGVKS